MSLIRLSANHALVLEEKDSHLVLAAKKAAGHTEQHWVFEPRSAGSFALVCVKSGHVVSVEDGNIESGKTITVVKDEGKAWSRWIFSSSSLILNAHDQTLALDLKDGNMNAGAVLVLTPAKQCSSQQFEVADTQGHVVPAPQSGDALVFIQSAHSASHLNLVLEVLAGDEVAENDHVQLRPKGPVDVAGLGERQIWTLQPRNGGSFAIVCKNTDLLLGLHNGHLEDSASVVLRFDNGKPSSYWRFVPSGVVVNAQDDTFCLAMKGDITTGAELVVSRTKSTALPAQQFVLTTLQGITLPPPLNLPTEPVFLQSAHPDLVFEAGLGHEGDKVQLAKKKSGEHADVQLFLLQSKGGNTYSIACKKSGLVLDVHGGQAAEKERLVLSKDLNKPSQRWIFASGGGLLNAHIKSLAVDVHGGKIAAGSDLELQIAKQPFADHQHVTIVDSHGKAHLVA